MHAAEDTVLEPVGRLYEVVQQHIRQVLGDRVADMGVCVHERRANEAADIRRHAIEPYLAYPAVPDGHIAVADLEIVATDESAGND
jgi:hypothetical protein